jgi:hypothetical protein
MEAQGFKHIIILDGDELWVPGTLKLVDNEVARNQPPALACRMIPVVGLPGYPIDEAQDIITVYIRSDQRFANCRSPICETKLLEHYGVIHFTACRKTMQEIIDKHLGSGHGDDPDYDMKGWVEKVLPNVKPGMTNVHMYKKWQIWPRARNWRVHELEYIPQTIWPYLGIDQQPSQSVKSSAALPMTRGLVNYTGNRVCSFSSAREINVYSQTVRA